MRGVILIKIFVQYLLTPIPFLLTFVTPILFFLISRKYVWLSIPLTVLVELLVNWRNFTYYESRGADDLGNSVSARYNGGRHHPVEISFYEKENIAFCKKPHSVFICNGCAATVK